MHWTQYLQHLHLVPVQQKIKYQQHLALDSVYQPQHSNISMIMWTGMETLELLTNIVETHFH